MLPDGLAAQFLVTPRRFYSPLSASFLLLFCTLYRLLCGWFYRTSVHSLHTLSSLYHPHSLHCRHNLHYPHSLHCQYHPHRQRLSATTILIALLGMSGVFNANALSVKTANAIQGTPPYLTFDGGVTKVTNVDELLAITLSDGTRYTPSTNSSSASNPIVLPVAGQTLADVQMAIPANLDSIALNSLISAPYNYWGDENGDGQGSNGITATGTVSIRVYDSNNKLLKRNDVLNRCNASYYRVVLNSTAGTLTTKYGSPRNNNFTASNVTYYIKPRMDDPYACYAQPNLTYSGGNYNGRADQWSETKGFILQDINNPSANFPTKGMNGLFFNLTLINAVVSDLSYEMQPTSSDINLTISGSGNVTKVTLVGPKDGDPVGLTSGSWKPTFTLYATKNGTKTKIYTFKISNWFIVTPGSNYTYNGDFCKQRYGGYYRIPEARELINGYLWGSGIAQPDHYVRWIGDGLFAEWGNMSSGYYPNMGLSSDHNSVWTPYFCRSGIDPDPMYVNYRYGSADCGMRGAGTSPYRNAYICIR
ncbi:hypothetical protein PT273_09120 [Orbaceae bacterium ESL0727]|nr:hypothetical protein [Orbaceae bacterium ESL0727]